MDIQDRFITVKGLRIHTLCAGDTGSPVLLLHGGGIDCARLSWGPIIGPLAAAGHRVVAPDCPGYGESDKPDVQYSFDYYIDFVGDLMEVLPELTGGCLMGLSMGGAIALGTALRWPARAGRLVLVDSYGLQRTVAMHKLSYLMVRFPGLMESTYTMTRGNRAVARAGLRNILHDASKASEALVDDILAEVARPQIGRAWVRMQRSDMTWSGLRTVYIDRLNEICVPTLILHGREDKLVPLRWAEEAHARIAGSKLHVIDNAGHWPHPEKAEEMIQVVTEFLS